MRMLCIIKKKEKMKLLKLFLFSFFVLFCFTGFSQIGGNQIYSNTNYSSTDKTKALQSIRTTDSTLTISTRVLLNKEPDFYFVSLGVSQEGKTVKEGLNLINDRINNLTKNFNSIGIKKDDYYIDFVSQTKIYDYTIDEDRAEQFEDGFEIKKNLIIKLSDLNRFDKLIELASEQDIYDIIKVDYRNNDVNSIYTEMYNASTKIIDDKKELYLKTNSNKVYEKQRITSDNFYSIYPNSQYKKYQAYETSDVNVYSKSYTANYIKKQVKKSTTFFYDGAEISGFDKIINSNNPTVGIQYFLELSIIYEITK